MRVAWIPLAFESARSALKGTKRASGRVLHHFLGQGRTDETWVGVWLIADIEEERAVPVRAWRRCYIGLSPTANVVGMPCTRLVCCTQSFSENLFELILLELAQNITRGTAAREREKMRRASHVEAKCPHVVGICRSILVCGQAGNRRLGRDVCTVPCLGAMEIFA